MERGVAGADVAIAVISPKYIQSNNCGFEMELAELHGKEVVLIVFGLPFSPCQSLHLLHLPANSVLASLVVGTFRLFQLLYLARTTLLPRLFETLPIRYPITNYFSIDMMIYYSM